ncbi:MAG: hypothetical protein S4CHLAM123_11660 [Chlamydiales bacterium]|nr:hypothetical protein [Chlamydiales bacterium]
MKFFAAVVLLAAQLHLPATDISNSLSINERFYLEKFFKIAICDDHFGYSLFFNKPMSVTGYFLQCPSHELGSPYKNKLVKKGWKVWKKHADQMAHSGFIFCEERIVFYDPYNACEIEVCNIYLINKRILQQTVQSNLAIFRERLGEAFSVDGFVERIEATKTVTPHIGGDEMLLGILLGFGKEASMLFERYATAAEIGGLTAVMSEPSIKEKVQPVVFVGDPSSLEVRSILDSYQGQAQYLENVCRGKKLLKMVFQKLNA